MLASAVQGTAGPELPRVRHAIGDTAEQKIVVI